MALRGIKVMEFAGLAPVPLCGMILADFGATVTKIDRSKGGMQIDPLDHGKKSIALDLKRPDAINIVKKLSKVSDVLVEPFRPGVMEKLGIGPDVLLKENPKLIYARLTGFGQSGYYHKRAGHDINYLATSGLLSLIRRKHEKPIFPLNLMSDFGGGGLMCALGILMALFERSRSGLGQIVDHNMVEGSAYLGSFIFRSQNLPIWGNPPGENILDTGAHFYEVYETKDGKFMSVGAIEDQFYAKLIECLGLDIDEVGQYDFENGKEIFKKKFLEKTQDEWVKIFDNVDACVMPVLDLQEAENHPHNKTRQTFYKTSDDLISPNVAPQLSRTPGVTRGKEAKPILGQHTQAVLEELGYSDQEILNFHKNGIIKLLEAKL